MTSEYSPHDHGVVDCRLHFGQHHKLVIVTQLLNVTQHQLNPEHITVTRVILVTLQLTPAETLSASHCLALGAMSPDLLLRISCCPGCLLDKHIFIISFNLFSSFSQLTREALAAAAAAPALVETCCALAAPLPPPPLLSLQSHRVAGKKLRWSARAHCAGLDNGPCVTTEQCGVYRRVLHHLPMMTLAKLSSGAGLGSSIISPGRFSRQGQVFITRLAEISQH